MYACVTASGKSLHVFILHHNEENQEKHKLQVTFSKWPVVKFIAETFELLEEGSGCEYVDCFHLSGVQLTA